MSNAPSFTITGSDFTYVQGNQINYNYNSPGTLPGRGARHSGQAEDPNLQTPPRDTTGEHAHSESPQAPPPPNPQLFAAHPRGSQQHPSQSQPNQDTPWNAASPPPSIPIYPPFDSSINPNAQPPSSAINNGYSQVPTPVQSPPLEPKVTGTPNSPFTQLASSDTSQAIRMPQATQIRSQNNRRRGEKGPVPAQSKQ